MLAQVDPRAVHPLMHIWLDIYCLFSIVFVQVEPRAVHPLMHLWLDIYCVFSIVLVQVDPRAVHPLMQSIITGVRSNDLFSAVKVQYMISIIIL